MSWTNKSLKHLNQEREETKEIAEELYHTFMSYLPQRERDEFIQRYNLTPDTTNTDMGKMLIKDIHRVVRENWY
tara:strand:+ start:455 stop:676 length:222 start_codon:yes stop_codon:yes gene_type:complete